MALFLNNNTRPEKPIEYRPAFNAWRRRLDPYLSAEDTNGLFQAFRERRLRSWPERPVIAALTTLMLSSETGLVYFLLVVCGGGALLWGFIAAFLIAVLAIWFSARIGRGSSFEIYLLPLLAPKEARHRQFVTDLWLTGQGGRSLVEAVYLERAETSPPWVAKVYIAAFVVLHFASMLRATSQWSVGSLCFLASQFVLFAGLIRVHYKSVLPILRLITISGVVRNWSKVNRFRDRIKKPKTGAGNGFAIGFLWVVALLFLFGYAFCEMFLFMAAWTPGTALNEVCSRLGIPLSYEWTGTAVTLAAALPLWLLAGLNRSLHGPHLESFYDGADAHFERYFAIKVMGDGD